VHVPDGYINLATSLGAGALSAGGVSLAVRKTADWMEDRRIPLTGLMSAFIFAAQMLNFPVVAGTSGHVLGSVLAAVLVGPWAGALCITVVLVVQALFADGGLTALGLNVLNMALVAGGAGYLIFLGMKRVLGSRRGALAAAAGVAAGISVVLSAAAFVIEFAVGGNVPVSPAAVATSMISVHLLIGIGEGLVTAAVVALVLGSRPDLVYGAEDQIALRSHPETALVGSG
jgi:cobalt/nickel transport system permease protein